MSDKTLKLGHQVREASVVEAKDNQITFSLSSETPATRYYGTEILSHDKKSIRMERIKGGAMPMLFNHNWDDPIGMIDRGRVEDGKLYVDAHFFDTARAQEVKTMVSGGLRNVSIGYQVHTFEEDVKSNTFTAMDWEPLEGSIVSVPMDPSVGVNRNDDRTAIAVRVLSTAAPAASKGSQMADDVKPAAGASAVDVQVKDNGAPGMSGEQYERKRGEAIRKNAQAMGIDDPRIVQRWISSGADWDQIGDEAIKILEERSRQATLAGGMGMMTQKEQSKYSILRAINAMVTRDFKEAGLEFEISKEIGKKIGKHTTDQTFYIPMDISVRTVMQVGTGSMGGNLVGTDITGFIDILRNRSTLLQSGARTLTGLVGVTAIPKKAAAGGVQWIAEAGTATASEMTLSQLTLSPKALVGYQEYTKQLLLQGLPDVESLITMDLADSIAVELDRVGLVGTSGSTNPTGVRFTTGIGTANPTAGTAVAYTDLIRFQTTVAGNNALLPGFTYITTPAVAGIYMGKSRFTNSDTPCWEGGLLDGRVVGLPGKTTAQMLSGVMLAGDFSQVMIGQWQGVQIDVNPYSKFVNEIVGVKATLYADVGVRQPAAFAVGTGMTA